MSLLVCGSSHFASKAMGARSREPRAKIFAKGEILPLFSFRYHAKRRGFFRFGDPCLIEKAKHKVLCGSSHFASKAMGARSREPRAKIFAKGEILLIYFTIAAPLTLSNIPSS